MEIKQILKNIDVLLKYGLIAILLLSFLTYIFVFMINWEAYIFGVKLNGTSAGLYLLLKGMSAGSLAFLLMKYRRHTLAAAALAVLYFGYTFVDSAVTIQTLTDNLYSPYLLNLFIISLVFLIFHAFVSIFCNGDTSPTMIESAIDSIFTTIGTKKTNENEMFIGILLVLVLFVVVIFILPFMVALIFWLLGLF